MNSPIYDLESKGFVVMQYPPELRSKVEKAAELFKKFCNLPLEVKSSLPYSNNTAGVGYEFKDGSGKKTDRKENFDVTIAGFEWLAKNVARIDNPVVLEFVRSALDVIPALKPLVIEFARESERAFGLEGFTHEVEQSIDTFFVRLIHYEGDRVVGEEMATAHVDQSGCTPHLFESAPGLQCLNYEGKWVDMPVSEGETVIIPDMQMQFRSAGRLRALCHRVVATRESLRRGRYSAVCFVQFKDTPKYDKDRHGRLQEKQPGFNYHLPPREFVKLFKQ